MPRGKKKSKPEVDATITLIVGEGTTDDDAANLAALVEQLGEDHDGLNVFIGYADSEREADEGEEDEEEADEEEEDEDEDEEGEGDEEDERYSQEDLEELENDDLKAVAEEWEVDLPGRMTDKGRTKVIAALLDAMADYFGDEGEEEEEEDDEEELDEEALEAMSPPQVKKVYLEVVGKKPPARLKKPGMIAKIMEHAEDEE